MKINSIELRNFRSYPSQTFSFDPVGNLLIGANGSGKTNLLEAIAYTSIGKSIRYHKDEELMAYGQDFFAVEASYVQDSGNSFKVQLSYASGGKILKLDGVISRQLSALLGMVKVVYSAPEDIQLVNGSPRLRRQYFDMAISQLFPDYLSALRQYLHSVDQRNALLKQDYTPAQKSVWDQRFAQSLCEVYAYRKRYLELLNEAIQVHSAQLSDSFWELRAEYRPLLKDALNVDIEKVLSSLEEIKTRENMWQRTLLGAHLDDYSFRFGEHSLRAFGSGGQKRMAVIMLKLVQATLIHEHTQIHPIMLFDDIFAELDICHSQRIRALCSERFQSIIASPKADIQEIFHDFKVIPMGACT